MAGRKDLFVTLTTDMTDLTVAEDLRKSLDCEKHVFFQDVLDGIETFPVTQTRISFHGHGSTEIFGSQGLHFNPEEFAVAMINVLNTNKQITDIDLLSCDVGLVDAKGYSYAGTVQDILQKSHPGIRVNTFVVDNTKNDVYASFFVVGVNASDSKVALGRQSLLRGDEFSLDILRKSNEAQMMIYQELTSAYENKVVPSTKKDILDVIYLLINSNDDENINVTKFEEKMAVKGYSHEAVAKLIDQYHIQFINNDDTDPHIKADILTQKQADYVANYLGRENVANGVYLYTKDALRAGQEIEAEIYHIDKDILSLSDKFSVLRASDGRRFKDKLSNIRHYLEPAHNLFDRNTVSSPHQSASSSTDHTLSSSSMFTHHDTHQTNKPDEKASETFTSNSETIKHSGND